VTIEGRVFTETWRDPAATPAERVRDLLSRMTLREKIAQLYGVWVGVDAARGEVVPHQHAAAPVPDWEKLIDAGRGHPGGAPGNPDRAAPAGRLQPGPLSGRDAAAAGLAGPRPRDEGTGP